MTSAKAMLVKEAAKDDEEEDEVRPPIEDAENEQTEGQPEDL